MLASLSLIFTSMSDASEVLPADEKQQVAQVLEDDAEFMSNAQLGELLVGQPEDVQAEIIRINTDARPIALQIALLIPILSALVGIINALRMRRLPDPKPSGSGKAMLLD
jgi:hypothetical protein